MRIAILSDIHDSLPDLDAVLEAAGGMDALLCCGDLCRPPVVVRLAGATPGPVHVVFGNCDGDRAALREAAEAQGNVTCHGEFAEVVLDGRKIALHHDPEMASAVAAMGRYDIVCYGHTHRCEVRRVGGTLLVNPGDVSRRYGRCTYAVYDTRSGEATIGEV